MISSTQQTRKSAECTCACGATTFQVASTPLFRILCHCTICQRFNSAPFADVLVFRAKHVTVPSPGVVNFDTYRPPPNVRRGKCAKCNQPAIEVFAVPVLPKLVMVPRAMLGSDAKLAAPVAHVFYDKRAADADDRYPKHRGYLRSQIAFLKYFRHACSHAKH